MPLLTAELNKVELRQLAKALGLPNWNQPNSACLSSRIPTGYPIDAAALARIQEAENQVRALGFRQVRVRHLEHGRVARVEVDPEEVERLEELWEKLAKRLLSLGYEHISYNPDGYQKPGTVKEEE